MRKIILYGVLGKIFGKVHRYKVGSPVEAVSALMANYPKFLFHLVGDGSPGYRVKVDGKFVRDEDGLIKYSETGIIRIIPVVQGAGKGKSIGTIFLGITLAVLGFVTQQPWLIQMGASIALSGAASLLTQYSTIEESNEEVENRPNYSFNGIKNTLAQGNPVPVVYGEVFTGGHIISFGVHTESITDSLEYLNLIIATVIFGGFVQGSGGGGKGGGGGSRTPKEVSDTLHSTQYARLQIAVSEGEIEGLVDGLKSVYLDDTPIQNQDGTFNFKDVSLHFTYGTQAQLPAPGFTGVEREITVSQEITKDAPVVKTITDPDIDAVRITVGLPQLYEVNKENGDINRAFVSYNIYVQADGGGFKKLKTVREWGKTTSRYQRNINIQLFGDAPWDIKLERITDDNEKSHIENETWFDSYTEVIQTKFSYPNTAVISIELNAEKFKRVPKIGFHLKGLVIKVPSNYDPIARTYDGEWDGTFKMAWTNNPAWCFYDFCMEKRYGIGQYIPEFYIDRWELYAIGRYCDELVDDGSGKGTKEPRFTFNMVFQTQKEAYTVLVDMVSSFRGKVFWGSGLIKSIQDRPEDTTQLFNNSNVVNGFFNYAGMAKNARHTVINVKYNDPKRLSKQTIESVEDAEAIAEYGLNPRAVVAIGCSSRGQAHRVAKHILLTERYENELVDFKVGLDGAFAFPGQVIDVNDYFRGALGGRIKGVSADLMTITLDRKVPILASKFYVFFCRLPDGSIEKRNVVSNAGNTNSLTLTLPLSKKLIKKAIWNLAADDLVPQLFRILSVKDEGKNQLGIIALKYNPDKFAAIESDIRLQDRPTFRLPKTLQKPVNINIREINVNDQGTYKGGMSIGWEAVPEAVRFFVRYKRFNDNFKVLPETKERYVEVYDILPGPYEIEITAFTFDDVKSPVAIKTVYILGKNKFSVMPDVKNLRLMDRNLSETEFTGKDVRLKWDEIITDDIPENAIFKDYEIHIRDGITGKLLHVENTTNSYYTFDAEKNADSTDPQTTPTIPPRKAVKISLLPIKISMKVLATILKP